MIPWKFATVFVITTVIGLSGAPCAFGQFGVAIEEVVAEEDEDEAEEAPALPAGGARRVVRQQRLQPEVFEQWVFQGTTEKATRDRLHSLLTMRINDIDRVSSLTEPQSQKLDLAGRMDIKRLFDQVEAGRRRFDAGRVNQGNAALIHRDIQPLRQILTNESFAEGSLFDKTVRNMLTTEQLPQYRKLLQDRKDYRLRAVRETILLTLDKQVPLREGQREKLRELLAESRPVNPGQFESHAMWYVASKLPAEKYQAILTDNQWNVLKARFAQVQNLEPFLKQNGAFPEDDEKKE